MNRFAAYAAATSPPANKTILAILGNAVLRGGIYAISLGPRSTPVESFSVEHLKLLSADGNGTAVTPVKLDGNQSSVLSTVKKNYSAEPTYVAQDPYHIIPLYSKLPYDLILPDSQAFIIPVGITNGVGLVTTAIGAPFEIDAMLKWFE